VEEVGRTFDEKRISVAAFLALAKALTSYWLRVSSTGWPFSMSQLP
jgi:hypothetical protein